MTRVVQRAGKKGSLKWIQMAINDRWGSLSDPILARLRNASHIDWKSPLEADDYAEYRDGSFLDLVGQSDLRPQLQKFWPNRGPQWDALGVTNRHQVLLVEAKAHIGEMCSGSTAAAGESRAKILRALEICSQKLSARVSGAEWANHFYQLANRLAHLQFLRDQGVDAYLVLVNFLNDSDMGGPTLPETWQAAYDVALHVMGLGRRHARYRRSSSRSSQTCWIGHIAKGAIGRLES